MKGELLERIIEKFKIELRLFFNIVKNGFEINDQGKEWWSEGIELLEESKKWIVKMGFDVEMERYFNYRKLFWEMHEVGAIRIKQELDIGALEEKISLLEEIVLAKGIFSASHDEDVLNLNGGGVFLSRKEIEEVLNELESYLQDWQEEKLKRIKITQIFERGTLVEFSIHTDHQEILQIDLEKDIPKCFQPTSQNQFFDFLVKEIEDNIRIDLWVAEERIKAIQTLKENKKRDINKRIRECQMGDIT